MTRALVAVPVPWLLRVGRCDGCGEDDDALIPLTGADVDMCPACTARMLWLEEDYRAERAECAALASAYASEIR